jgi:hypothetical protein
MDQPFCPAFTDTKTFCDHNEDGQWRNTKLLERRAGQELISKPKIDKRGVAANREFPGVDALVVTSNSLASSAIQMNYSS